MVKLHPLRVFIARALPEYLSHVSPADAVEYILPLLNGLGTDPGVYSSLGFVYPVNAGIH